MKNILENLFIAILKLINKMRFKNPREQVNSNNVLIYCPNIGGHRPVYASKFIDYYHKRGFTVYFVYFGLQKNLSKSNYSGYQSRFIESFRGNENIHLICALQDFYNEKDELGFIVKLQKKYNAFLTIFVDGDILMKVFVKQVLPGTPRLIGRNYAVFILIDFIYLKMDLLNIGRYGVWKSSTKKRQLPHMMFHKFLFRHLDLIDGALCSDENLIEKIKPSKHIFIGDITHYTLPSDNNGLKNNFFIRVINEFDRFLDSHSDKDVILQFGELENRKGFDFNLRLVAEHPDLVLVRAGRTKPSYKTDWESITNKEKLLLEGRIFEVDIFIDSQEFINKIFNSIKYLLFAYKSFFRTSMMLPLALSYTKPVLVPNYGLLCTRVRKHKIGRIYKNKCYDSYVSEFLKLRNDHELYHDNVKKYFQEEFSDESFVIRLDKLTNDTNN